MDRLIVEVDIEDWMNNMVAEKTLAQSCWQDIVAEGIAEGVVAGIVGNFEDRLLDIELGIVAEVDMGYSHLGAVHHEMEFENHDRKVGAHQNLFQTP